jgi:hypothetical protein
MKEQRQQLNKVQAPNIALGKIEMPAGGNVSPIAPIAPEKSSGERLAAALNITANAGAQIYEQVDAQKAAFDSIEATAQATDFSHQTILEASSMSDDDKLKHYAAKTKEFIGQFQGKYKVSDKAFIAGTAVVNKYLGDASNAAVVNKSKDAIVDMQEKTRKTINEALTLGGNLKGVPNPTPAQIVDFLKKDLQLNAKEAGDFYIDTVIASISQQVTDDYRQNKPVSLEVYQAAIKEKLQFTTNDGINYKNHPTYEPKVKALEASISTLSAAQAKQNQGLTYMNLYEEFSNLTVGDVNGFKKARETISANKNKLETSEFDRLQAFLRSIEKGDRIVDNVTNVTKAYAQVLKGVKPTPEFFQKWGIQEISNMKTLVSAYEKPGGPKADGFINDYMTMISLHFKQGFMDKFDDKKRKTEELAKKKYLSLVKGGMESAKAFAIVEKEFMNDTPKPVGGGTPPKPKPNVNNLSDVDIASLLGNMK